MAENSHHSSSISSPDPLALSYDSNTPSIALSTPSKRRTIASPSKRPLSETSPNKTTPTARRGATASSPAETQTLVFTTPTKQRGTRAGAQQSPMRIHVTLRAEQDEDAAVVSPARRTGAGTATYTVPTKEVDGDGAMPLRRGRGRPRKSDAEGEEKRRDQTPLRRVTRGAKGKKDEGSEMASTKGKRKSAVNGAGRTPAKRGRSTSSAGKNRAAQDDEEFTTFTNDMDLAGRVNFQSVDVNDQDDQRSAPDAGDACDEVSDQQHVAAESLSCGQTSVDVRQHGTAMHQGHDTFSPQNASGDAFGEDLGHSIEYAVEEDDGLLNYEDTAALDRSLVESEGFSMVSIESLRSQKEQAEREAEALEQQQASESQAEAEAENNKEPRHDRDRTSQTPLMPQKSPIVPEAPQSSPTRSSPEIASAVKAGTALQKAIGNSDRHEAKTISKKKGRLAEMEQQQRIFEGFSDGTRKNLRASLAMGELLARGDKDLSKSSSQPIVAMRADVGNELRNPTKPHLTGSPQLPTPAESVDSRDSSYHEDHTTSLNTANRPHGCDSVKSFDRMSWKPTHFDDVEESTFTRSYDDMSWAPASHRQVREDNHWHRTGWVDGLSSKNNVAQSTENDNVDVPVMGKAEEYHQEAELVNTEQAAAYEDIWQEEAERSLQDSMEEHANRKRPAPTQEADDKTPNLDDLLGEDLAPRRAKIPRTWRRTSGSMFLYSDEVESPARAPVQLESAVVEVEEKEEKTVEPASTPAVLRKYLAFASPFRWFQQPEPSVEPSQELAVAEPTPVRTPSKSILVHPTSRASANQCKTPTKEVHFEERHAEEDNEDDGGEKDDIRDSIEYVDTPGRLGQPPASPDSAVSEVSGSAADFEDADSHRSPSHHDSNNDDTTVYGDQQLFISGDSSHDGHTQSTTSDIRQLRREFNFEAPNAQNDASTNHLNFEAALSSNVPAQPAAALKSNTSSPTNLSPPAQPTHHHHHPTDSTRRRRLNPHPTTTTVLGHLFSFLPAWLNPLPSTSLHPPPPTEFNHNHRLLLTHHLRLTLHPPWSNDILPAHALSSSLLAREAAIPLPAELIYTNPLPHAYARFVGQSYARPRRLPGRQRVLREADLRAAWAFVREARDKGVPKWCDGRRRGMAWWWRGRGRDPAGLEANADASDAAAHGAEWPMRGPDGRIVRVREEWKVQDVVKWVGAVWVEGVQWEEERRAKAAARHGAGEEAS